MTEATTEAPHAAEHAPAAVPGDPTAAPPALVLEIRRAALAGDAPRALQLMAQVSPAAQGEIATAIGKAARKHFAEHMPTRVGEAQATRDTAKALFDHTPDDELATLQLWFGARFRLQFTTLPESLPWSADGLRRLWIVYEALPAGHVANNWAVARLTRYADTQEKPPDRKHRAHGVFSGYPGSAGQIALSYTDTLIENGGTTDHDMEGDPLHGVNRFDEVARHEIGHAVDRELGKPSIHVLGKTAEAGHWERYTDLAGYQKAAGEMVTGSAGAIAQLPEGPRKKVLHAMAQSMLHSTTKHFVDAIASLHEYPGLKDDPVYDVMTKGLADLHPWRKPTAIAGRHYHQGYSGGGDTGGGRWVSYDQVAWDNHRVSEYQFREVQEWFAEAYSAFYTPVGPTETRGALLAQRMPQTRAWFAANVDNSEAVAEQARRARKKDHAPRKP